MSLQVLEFSSEIPYLTISGHENLKINVQDLAKFTLLVGPNESGKTTILELIGLTLIPLSNTEECGLGLSLINMLRPLEKAPRIPDYVLSRAKLSSNNEIMIIYVKIEPNNVEKTFKIIRKLSEENLENISKIVTNILSINIRNIPELIRKFFEDSEIELYSKFLRKEFIPRKGEKISLNSDDSLLEKLFESYPYKLLLRALDYVALVFVLSNNKLHKMLIIKGPDPIIVKEKHKYYDTSLIVFHPVISHVRGIVEELYRTYILDKKVIPNEKKAIEILSNYIKGFEGFEIIDIGKRQELHIKVNSKRISIYKLSDGYRLAVILSLLYAFSQPYSIYLIDTPEAFVHPDGLSIVSEIISELAINTSQIILATQSIELLKELLTKVNEKSISNMLTIKRISIKNSTIRDVGSWHGDTAYSSLMGLEIDLRI